MRDLKKCCPAAADKLPPIILRQHPKKNKNELGLGVWMQLEISLCREGAQVFAAKCILFRSSFSSQSGDDPFSVSRGHRDMGELHGK